ncbi:MAG: AAA family ATPase [Deltaproteobacteria bacterium]|nr:AAA family ATPase [Deltaproteobacteria bacterium]
MILHSIKLENWRCFIEPVTVGPFSETLNILHAPNATGKSTLFEALRRALLDSHRVKSKELEAVRPWGRVLSPSVTVEFTHGGETYRITKQFLDKPMALLERKEKGRFVRLFEGHAADEEVQRIFTKNPSAKGLTRFQNWGLAQILWAPQGDLSYTQLTGDVIEDIQSFLDVQVTSGSDEGIEKRIEELYHRYFTPGGKLKSGKDAPKLVSLIQQLEGAEERYKKAVEEQAQYEDLIKKVEELRAKRSQYKQNAEEANKALETARLKVEGYKKLVSEKMQRKAKLEALDAKYLEMRQRIDTFESVKTELMEVRETLSKYEEDLPLREKELKDRQQKLEAAKEKLEKVRDRREEISKLHEKLGNVQRFLRNYEKLRELSSKVKMARKIQGNLEGLKKKISTLVAPDAHVLKELYKTRREYQNALSYGGPSVTVLDFIPELEGAIEIKRGMRTGEFRVIPGETITIKGIPDIEVYYKGVARIKISGLSLSTRDNEKKLREAEKKIQKLTKPFGTDDMEVLEKRREAFERISREIFETETKLKSLLEGFSSLGAMEKELLKAKKTTESLLKRYPEWSKNPPNVEALKMEVANFSRLFSEELGEAEAEWELAQTAFSAAKSALAGLASKIEELNKRRKNLEVKYSEMVENWGSFDNMMKTFKKLALSLETARSSLEEIEERLVSYGEDPTQIIAKLEDQLRLADELSQKALEEEKNMEGMMAQLASMGTYTQLAAIEEEKAKLEEEIRQEQIQVDAVSLLYETLVQVRSETLSGLVGPVERIATKTLHRIAGGKLNQVKLGESFEPSHIHPEVSETPVTLDNVSGGEREQIYLATRLALAEIIAKKERQLVVLDDVLTFTDAGRFARILSVLEEAAQKLQLLVLTCHPERYQGLSEAQFIDLEAIRFSA